VLGNPLTGGPSKYHAGFYTVRGHALRAFTQMEKEILSQAEAGAVGSHSSEAATGPARQEDTA